MIPTGHEPSITIGTCMRTPDIRIDSVVHALDTAGIDDVLAGGFPDLHK
jgi:hypothetical protein